MRAWVGGVWGRSSLFRNLRAERFAVRRSPRAADSAGLLAFFCGAAAVRAACLACDAAREGRMRRSECLIGYILNDATTESCARRLLHALFVQRRVLNVHK